MHRCVELAKLLSKRQTWMHLKCIYHIFVRSYYTVSTFVYKRWQKASALASVFHLIWVWLFCTVVQWILCAESAHSICRPVCMYRSLITRSHACYHAGLGILLIVQSIRVVLQHGVSRCSLVFSSLVQNSAV